MRLISHGFSLIEVSISISLLILIITLTFPSLWFLKQQEVASEVEKLYSIFMYLQQSAITSHKDRLLEFDQENNSYSFIDNNSHQKEKLSVHVKFSIKNNVKGPPSTPNKILTKPITFINNQVTFFANGTIQPGTVYLTDSKKNYLYAITVPISQISLIRKYKYLDKWIMID